MSIMGNRIREKRQEQNLTLEELGKKLGVQSSAVSKWESGRVENIKRSTIMEMAKIFDCDPVWLAGLEIDEPLPFVTEGSSVEYIDDSTIKIAFKTIDDRKYCYKLVKILKDDKRRQLLGQFIDALAQEII